MTVLAVDAMYFHAAMESLGRAAAASLAVKKADTKVARHLSKIEALKEEHEREDIADLAYHERLERLAIQMEDIEYGVGATYGPLLQRIAAVHFFAVASLEAHVNQRAQQHFGGQPLDEFEKLSLRGKWLFLPKMLGVPGFDPGQEPFQAFGSLIRWRNRLVHYRAQREPWDGSSDPPHFLQRLGLSVASARKAVATVPKMVKILAQQLGDDEPWWLDADKPSYFEVQMEEED